MALVEEAPMDRSTEAMCFMLLLLAVIFSVNRLFQASLDLVFA
jgi:hypothetical protein